MPCTPLNKRDRSKTKRMHFSQSNALQVAGPTVYRVMPAEIVSFVHVQVPESRLTLSTAILAVSVVDLCRNLQVYLTVTVQIVLKI
jgi:lysyl-tRNA synthetase class I